MTPSEPVVPSEPVTPSEPEEVFVHLDGCTEECTDEECACLCHVFQELMECQNYDEFMSLLNGISSEDYAKFTKKQVEQIEQKLLELKPACTCIANEDGTLTYTEGCPVHEAPAAESGHIEGCSDECTNEECTCLCHLFDRLMAMQTQDEIVLVLMELSPETIAAFTVEQAMAIEAHFDSLSTTAAVSGDTMTPGDETVVGSSEVRYLTYDFTDAAPFMGPVEGGN